jgi:hypothetical protein
MFNCLTSKLSFFYGKNGLILFLWFVALSIGLFVIVDFKKITIDPYKRRCFWGGLLILCATAAMLPLVTEDRTGAFVKDYVLLFGSAIGGGLFLQGVLK